MAAESLENIAKVYRFLRDSRHCAGEFLHCWRSRRTYVLLLIAVSGAICLEVIR